MSTKLNNDEIKKIIPHRDPILLVDEVVDFTPGESILARYYVDPEMDILRGHFPEMPVYPGVYTVEAMAQTACIFLLSMEKYKNKMPLFLGIDKTKFMKKVSPGDTIDFRLSIISERPEKAIATFAAEATVNGEPVASGELTLAIR
jgi:3-hydroxyacyl-[acyl-carrier-protein] dehydratase